LRQKLHAKLMPDSLLTIWPAAGPPWSGIPGALENRVRRSN